jgi:hypothetical protein
MDNWGINFNVFRRKMGWFFGYTIFAISSRINSAAQQDRRQRTWR